MAGDAHRAAFQQALAEAEARLHASPGDIEIQFERARLLTCLGEDGQATAAYLSILQRAPSHFGALTNIASLALSGGHRTAAMTAYRQAAALHPDKPAAQVNLANVLLGAGEIGEARQHYEAALALDPESADAHRGLAQILLALGDEAGAEKHLGAATAGSPLVQIPYRGLGVPLRLLMLVSARGGNIPTELLLSDRLHAMHTLYVEGWDGRTNLPPHDLVFNAIGDADLCGRALDKAREIAKRTNAPILNPPVQILATTREGNAKRLSTVPRVRTPRTMKMSRDRLESEDAEHMLSRSGFVFPLLLRAPGFHTGQHFLQVNDAGGLGAAVAKLPGREMLVIEPLDARDPDGLSRKYRVMFIGGALYPLHLAASTTWKVHYFTSAMAERPDLRAEEAKFLESMPLALGPRIMAALQRISEILGLDYAGIDFGISPEGDLLLFEANATMVMVPPGPDSIWDYRRKAITRAIDAARQLFVRPA